MSHIKQFNTQYVRVLQQLYRVVICLNYVLDLFFEIS